MKRAIVVLLIGALAATAVFSDRAYAGGRNKNRNLLIATSALGGTLAGAVLGIFADRAFLVNSPSANQSDQRVSYSPAVYQQPLQAPAPALQNYGYQTGALAVAPIYIPQAIYPPDLQATGYNGTEGRTDA